MTSRPYNFSAGPAAMPEEVLEQAAAEMLDWHGSGMGVMEMSHRGKEFMSIATRAEADLRELLAVPAHFRILFMQGGGLAENAIVPMNLSRGGAVDFVITGGWSQKSAREARRYATANVIASNEADGHTTLPPAAGWRLGKDAQYVHICSNETIHGVEFHELPDLQALGCSAPLVIDFSSHVASRPVDWSRVGLAFGGAQKNLGPAGVTLVVVREDL
ncbi:MAG: 3-phosphoserine/phosphohydroxythreonine transaminase, partial [Gammaproteobacteria bacterium]